MAQPTEAAVASMADAAPVEAIRDTENPDGMFSVLIDRINARVDARLVSLTDIFISEIKRVQSETMAAIQCVQDEVTKTRRSGTELARQVSDVVADSHKKQIDAMNDILQHLTTGQQRSIVQYTDLKEGIPTMGFWDFVADKLEALGEARLREDQELDADGEPDTEVQFEQKDSDIPPAPPVPPSGLVVSENETSFPSASPARDDGVTVAHTRDAPLSATYPLRTASPICNSTSIPTVNDAFVHNGPEPYPSPVSQQFPTPSDSLHSEIFIKPRPSLTGSSSGSVTGGAKKWVPKKRGKKNEDPLNRRRRSYTAMTEDDPSTAARTKRKKLDVDWPPHIPLEDGRKPSLVKCDQCDAWYHTVCVGVDERSQNIESAVFVCPRCIFKWTTSAPSRTYGRRNGDSSSICSRPDCKVPKVKSTLVVQSDEEFVIEAIIGRRKCPYPFPQVTWQYLLKWEGYHLDESTWTLECDIAGIDVLVPQFEKAAAEEGLNPSVSETILLRVSKESSRDWLLIP